MCSVSAEFVRGGKLRFAVQEVPTVLIQNVVDGILQICATNKRNASRSFTTSVHNLLYQLTF